MATNPTTSSRFAVGTKVRYSYQEGPATAYGYGWVKGYAQNADLELVYIIDNGATVRARDVRAVRGDEE